MRKRLIKRGFGFPLTLTFMERRSIRTLLSQGAAGGACGTFFLLCVMVLSYPSFYNFLPAVLFPFYLVVGAAIGTIAGAVIWTLESGVERNWRILSRAAISTICKLPVFVLLSNIQKFDEKTLIYRYIAAIVFGLAILLFTSSNIRPWRMIARGIPAPLRLKILFSGGPIRISRTIEELKEAVLTGLPLRAAGLFALLVSVLLVIGSSSFFWWDLWSNQTLQDLSDRLTLVAYFSATVGVSFAVRNKWIVLALAAAVNAPWFVWMLPHGPNSDAAGATILVSLFFYLWLLFVTGIFASSVKKGELQVEYGHIEIRFGKQQWVRESQ